MEIKNLAKIQKHDNFRSHPTVEWWQLTAILTIGSYDWNVCSSRILFLVIFSSIILKLHSNSRLFEVILRNNYKHAVYYTWRYIYTVISYTYGLGTESSTLMTINITNMYTYSHKYLRIVRTVGSNSVEKSLKTRTL